MNQHRQAINLPPNLNQVIVLPLWQSFAKIVETWQEGVLYDHSIIAQMLGLQLPKEERTYRNTILQARKYLEKQGIYLDNVLGQGYKRSYVREHSGVVDKKVNKSKRIVKRARNLAENTDANKLTIDEKIELGKRLQGLAKLEDTNKDYRQIVSKLQSANGGAKQISLSSSGLRSDSTTTINSNSINNINVATGS